MLTSTMTGSYLARRHRRPPETPTIRRRIQYVASTHNSSADRYLSLDPERSRLGPIHHRGNKPRDIQRLSPTDYCMFLAYISTFIGTLMCRMSRNRIRNKFVHTLYSNKHSLSSRSVGDKKARILGYVASSRVYGRISPCVLSLGRRREE